MYSEGARRRGSDMKRLPERLSGLSAWRFVVVAAVVAMAAGAAAFGAQTLWNQAEAGVEEVRWGNVTLTVPGNSDMYYSRLPSAPQAVAQGIMGPMLLLETDESIVVIHAETGEVIYESVLPAERAAFDAVLATLEVGEAEVAAEAVAPWPYSSTPPNTPRQQWDPFSFILPDPAAGISVQPMDVLFIEPRPPGSNEVIGVFNTRSQMGVNGAGEVYVPGGSTFTLAEFVEADPSLLEGIHPDDREAFQRFAQTMEISPRPTPIPAPDEQTP
jgi:hypothetical protein